MSAFQINVTPTRLKNIKRQEIRQPTDVVMAPFSAKAVVQFEDVPVKKTAKRLLRVVNPSDEDIEVVVTKPVKPEYNISISWTENMIPAQSEIQMEMIWNPLKEVACNESMQLTDNRNFRKDVMIILKSSPIKKTTRRFPNISSGVATTHVNTLRLKSPKNGSSRNTKQQQQQQQQRRLRLIAHSEKPPEKTSLNLENERKMTGWIDTCRTVNQKKVVNEREKGTYISPLKEKNMNSIKCVANETLFNREIKKEKENVSPLTPNNVLSMIDKINFTPVTNEKPKASLTLDTGDPATWPITPVGQRFCDENFGRGLRPRRINPSEFNEECTVEIPQIRIELALDAPPDFPTDKTFVLKRIESVENVVEVSPSKDRLSLGGGNISGYESSVDGGGEGVLIMNKTATITATPVTRHLEMIQEEDLFDESTTEIRLHLTKTIDKSNAHESSDLKDAEKDLKRDIVLIGTPLKKYSESMKDLSLKSPSSKISNQGSMPNLSEKQPLRSIEQNRYYNQSSLLKPQSMKMGSTERILNAISPNSSSTYKSSMSLALQKTDYIFNKNEILAQSSRFNVNDCDYKDLKSPSPVLKKYKNVIRLTPESLGSRKATVSSSPTTPSPSRTASAKKRRSRELLTDSPTSEANFPATRKFDHLKVSNRADSFHISPPKRLRFDPDLSNQRITPVNASAVRSKNWSFTKPKKFKLLQTLSLAKNNTTPRKVQDEPRIKLYDSDLYLQSFINPDPFAATTTCDPFLTATMYLDEHAVERHQNDIKKWLNALVSIPADLVADSNAKIDVGKLFSEVRNKDLSLAPTKEVSSMNYLTKFRLESLRRAAVELFLSEEMRLPCSKVAVYVNKSAIRIRSDRNLHLDVVMQRSLLELLLCINPLWLRLGLEVVYGEKIHLNSNNDIVGLSSFILHRLFRDRILEQKYSKAYTFSDDYAEHIKKFTLQKILFFFLFIDKAKQHRIIKYNPCLFVKKSPYKETKEILLKFSSELLANVGDITRDLKRLGYELQHKQTFLDEFDYSFNNLAVDLRDGIRLTRVMEIILLREDLSKLLRVPAISRLQRIFNVNLALRALREAKFELKGDISAADIVDGHREKTLSLLWQIIYKFRSPKFHAAAQVIQRWWRRSWLRIVIMRRVRQKEKQRREKAAVKIQAAFRGYRTRHLVHKYREERTRAAIVLQKYTRRYLARRHFCKALTAVVRIQHWCRASRMGKQCRKNYMVLRNSCIFLQRNVRRRILANKLLKLAAELRFRNEKAVVIQRFMRSVFLHRKLQQAVMKTVFQIRQSKLEYKSATCIQSAFKALHLRREFKRKRAAAQVIQQQWRNYRRMCYLRESFILQRQVVIGIQRRFRAKLVMREQRRKYLQLRSATIILQRRFRAKRLMIAAHSEYILLKECAVKLQRRCRATLLMREQRSLYFQQRNAIIKLQQIVRAKQSMRQQRANYLRMRSSACSIQRYYRARLAMKEQRAAYVYIRESVIRIQRKWRATRLARRVFVAYISLQYYTTVLQQKFRAKKEMRLQQAEYQELKKTTILIQRCFRAKQKVRQERDAFVRQRNAALIIQRRFRAYKLMRFMRAKYQGTRAAVSCIQQYLRGYLLMKQQREIFKKQKQAALVIQRAFRAHRTALDVRTRYKRLRAAAVTVQHFYRARLCMLTTRQEYQHKRQMIISIQRRYRAKLLGRQVREQYAHERSTIIKLQQKYRANVGMRFARKAYLEQRSKIINLQHRFRAYLAMKRQRREYLKQRQAAVLIQSFYRATLQKHEARKSYQQLRKSCLLVQSRWRATLLMRTQRKWYLSVIQNVICLQRKWLATLQMRQQRVSFQQQKSAAILIQRRYRARLEMLRMRNQYLLIRSLIICVQRRYRARRKMLEVRSNFVLLKRTVLLLQQRCRGRLQTQIARERYLQLRKTTIIFQAHARGLLARRRFKELLTPEMLMHIQQKKAARVIQRYWRGYRVRRRWHNINLLQIRENIKLLKETSSAINSIRSKVQEAVRLLRGRFIASDALNVLSRLDRLSRTVPHLLMDHSAFISTFCYGIMAQTIRSEIDKHLVEYCSRIILNLARYNSSTAHTFQEGGLTTIAQMLLRWCDKNCEIFNTLCTLIWLFAHCPYKRKIIRRFMTTPEAIYIIREIKKLVARKEKMKQNVRNHLVSVREIQQQQNFSSRSLPRLDPDYGVIRNKPYIFISPVYAFETVLYKLGIDINVWENVR